MRGVKSVVGVILATVFLGYMAVLVHHGFTHGHTRYVVIPALVVTLTAVATYRQAPRW